MCYLSSLGVPAGRNASGELKTLTDKIDAVWGGAEARNVLDCLMTTACTDRELPAGEGSVLSFLEGCTNFDHNACHGRRPLISYPGRRDMIGRAFGNAGSVAQGGLMIDHSWFGFMFS